MSAVLALWLTLRLLLGAQAAFLSVGRPLTAIERLPPESFALTSDPWLWLERWVLAPWHRWDADWYVRILTSGYGVGDGTTQFHPLFIWVVQPLTWLGLSPLLAILLVSSVSGLGFLWVFHELAARDRSPALAVPPPLARRCLAAKHAGMGRPSLAPGRGVDPPGSFVAIGRLPPGLR